MSSRFAATSSSSKSSATSTKRKSSLIDILTISDDDPMGKASELDPAKRAGNITLLQDNTALLFLSKVDTTADPHCYS